MLEVLIVVYFVIFGFVMFNLGMMMTFIRNRWHRWRMRMEVAGRVDVSKDDIRNELSRDPVAMEMFMRDETPDDVQRYLYLEAERRAIMRKRRILSDSETDFFAPPRHPGPDPGFGHVRS